MKKDGNHEGCIEQIQRLFKDRLYTGEEIPVDEKGRIRIDDWEMLESVQSQVAELWPQASTESLPLIGDLVGYKSEFLSLFGFGLEGIDYTLDTNENLPISGLVE
jgi:enoyl-[acyl-carrier protein] reductase/trans-2-enoyl-CoA reductase (NAD+)